MSFSGVLHGILLLGIRLHFTARLARACLACLLRTFRSTGLSLMAAPLCCFSHLQETICSALCARRPWGKVDRIRRQLCLPLYLLKDVDFFCPFFSRQLHRELCLVILADWYPHLPNHVFSVVFRTCAPASWMIVHTV